MYQLINPIFHQITLNNELGPDEYKGSSLANATFAVFYEYKGSSLANATFAVF